MMARVPAELLRERSFLISMIRAAGVRDSGSYDPYAEKDGELLQDPAQFADALILLSRRQIGRLVEIGTWNGKSVCFMTAFLRRFNPDVRAVSIDPLGGFRPSYGLPVEFRVGTSADLKNESFDLCFIDGDHGFDWIKKDYENVGARAPVCMFHDIDNADFGILDPGRFWSDLKSAESGSRFHEFKTPGKHNMGIGIRLSDGAAARGSRQRPASAPSTPGAPAAPTGNSRSRRAVYYAINAAPVYLVSAYKSIASLRRFNSNIDVHVFISMGSASDAATADVFRGTGACVWLADKTKLGFPVDGYFERYFLKWLALRNLFYDSLLYVDADTVFSRDPEVLFDELSERHFYAREENGAAPEQKAEMIGSHILYAQIDHGSLAKAAASLSARKLPVFNTGVMLFNRSIHRDVAAALPRMYDVYKDLVDGRIPYPSVNAHIKEEIAAALVLGTIPGLTFDRIDPEMSPWYVEYKGGRTRSAGVVMHIWNEYLPFFLQEFEGDAGLIPGHNGGAYVPAEVKRRLRARLETARREPAPRRFESAPSRPAPKRRAPPSPWEMGVRQIPRMAFPRAHVGARNFFWRGLESASGPGSDLRHTEAIRAAIPPLLKEFRVRSLLDVPCGDLHWLGAMRLDLDRFVGVDFDPRHILKHTIRHAFSRPEFYCLDATRDALPAVDLILCRDLLMHFPYADALATLRNFKNTGSTYLLTTTYTTPETNSEVAMGSWFPINLQRPPFDLPPPIRLIDEGNEAAFGPEYAGKCLGLWKLADIPV